MMKIIWAIAACLVAVNAEKCLPGIVPAIELFPNNTLSFGQVLNNAACNISSYLITITDYDESTVQQFTYKGKMDVDPMLFDVSFLEACTRYGFEVEALTKEGVLSSPNKVDLATYAPDNLDYSLYFLGHTFNNSKFELSWDFNEKRAKKCVSYYRVVYWSDELEIPTDVYVTTTNVTLSRNIKSCVPYNFHVNAIVANPDHEGAVADYDWEGFEKGKPKAVEERIHDSEARPNVQVFLDNLSPNTTYTADVYLRNSAGNSNNVTITYKTSL